MPTTDPDKAYVKKHKLNDMLNELFISLKDTKPEDPIRFAYDHFKAKLPHEEPAKPKELKVDTTNLLSKLFDKQKDLKETGLPSSVEALNTSVANRTNISKATRNSSRVLSNYQIINKVDRVMAKSVNHETNEDIIENEMIVNFASNKNDGDQDQSGKKIIKYKNSLVKRETSNKHRSDLEKLLMDEISKKEAQRITENEVETTRGRFEEDFSEELYLGEVALQENTNRYSAKNLENVVKQRNVENLDPNKKRFRSIMVPNQQTIICTICAKVQTTINQPVTTEKINPETLTKSSGFLTDLLGKSANTLKNMTGKDVINPKAMETLKEATYTEETNNIFDLLHLTDKPKKSIEPILPADEVKEPVTTKDTARTAAIGANDDDDFIESASQVSGPRPIETYNPLTNRNSVDKSIPVPLVKDQNNIMNWLLTQKKTAPIKEDMSAGAVKEPSIAGSNASNKTLRSSTVGNQQQWNQVGSSCSDRSSTLRKKQ